MSAAVYVFKSEAGLVKIGQSRNPEKRLKRLQGASGFMLSMEHVRALENASAIERAAHALLQDKRRCGEWFDVSVEEAIAAIEKVIKTGSEALPTSLQIVTANDTISVDLASLSSSQCQTARDALNWTRRDLARLSRASTGTITNLERGKRINPSIRCALRLAFEAAGLAFIDADETAGEGVRLKASAEAKEPAEEIRK